MGGGGGRRWPSTPWQRLQRHGRLYRVTRNPLKGFYEEVGSVKKRKRKYHTLVSSASEFDSLSLSLPTSSCHLSEASVTRSQTADSFPSS